MKTLIAASLMVIVVAAAAWGGMRFQAHRDAIKAAQERREQAEREANARAAQEKREAQAQVHSLRLRYFGNDDHPDQPPTAAELAFFQAATDEALVKNRMEQASLEYQSEWGRWDQDKIQPPDPVLRRAKKAAHDVAMAAQADEIRALNKKIEAMKVYAAENGAAQPETRPN